MNKPPIVEHEWGRRRRQPNLSAVSERHFSPAGTQGMALNDNYRLIPN